MSNNPQTARYRGAANERVAAQLLQQHGRRLVTNKHHVKCGELDIVMYDQAILVFFEV
ncbi:MAG: YraN family protein, partial [Pseudomonadota bacterium]|nr:YraN family protein [Pseudomonadota bacterium]